MRRMAFLRWLVVVLGGLLLGIGVALHGQVALARHMRDRVDQTFVAWRWLGKATFAFQGGETRMALAMREVPEEALVASDRAAWVLLGVGGMVVLTGPLLRRGASRRVGRQPGR
jgi:hypothetical protein